MRRRARFFASAPAAASALLALLAVGCSEAETDEGEAAHERETAVSVEVAELEEVEYVERSLGRLRTLNDTTLSAEVEGLLVEVLVKEGDEVQQDEVLASIDPLDFELQLSQARAEIGQLESEIQTKEAEVERQRQLREGGHVSVAAMEQTEAELVTLEQQLVVARAGLASAQLNRDRSTIVAPLSGRISTRYVNEGEYMSSGQKMFRIVQGDRLEVELALPERLADKLEPGQPVRLQSTGADDAMVETTIKAILPTIGEDSSAIVALAELENPGKWRPGGRVHAEVVLEVRESIIVPGQGVVLRPEGEVVFIDQGGRAVERHVEVGQRTAEWVEVLSGIEAGERIIVDGAGFLADGVLVESRPRATAEDRDPATQGAPEDQIDVEEGEG